MPTSHPLPARRHAAARMATIALTPVLLGLLASDPAQAQSPAPAAAPAWPAKTIKFVNSFPPGGPSDILARATAEILAAQFKQPVIVENKPGAGGNVGADVVAKSPADGYTVLWGIDTTVTVNPHIYKNSPFKASELKTLMVMSSSGLLIGSHPDKGFKSLKDMIAAGKGKGLTFSSGGSGSPGHLAAEVFTDAAGVKINHIPYKGNSPAVMAVAGGEVDGGVLATPGMLPHVKSGKVVPLAVTSRQRSKLAPDVPTVAEAGIKELEQEVLYVVMLPAATPEPVVKQLEQALRDAIARPDMQQRFATLDMHVEGLTGTAAAKRISDLHDRYGRIIKATDMKVE